MSILFLFRSTLFLMSVVVVVVVVLFIDSDRLAHAQAVAAKVGVISLAKRCHL
jgi:uncharacterized membrane protein YqjE